jgi:VIT1/CCC1 family predicted Fe2+/Mn2+ transporter
MGANDGIVSIASLSIGVAAADVTRDEVLLAGVAGLVAGAMSMAAGEYVSVSSQADIQRADLELERSHLRDNPEFERRELADIYMKRGLDAELADKVAEQLMARDALAAHARDELGLSEQVAARPAQAALASAVTFFVGGALPVIAAAAAPAGWVVTTVAVLSLLALAGMGGLAAWAGGAAVRTGMARVAFWGALAMALTAAVGSLFGVAG